MGDIEKLTQINYVDAILAFFIVLFAIKTIIELFAYFKKKLGVKFGVETEKDSIEGRISKLEQHDKWQYNEIGKISKGIDEIKDTLAQKELRDNAKTVATLRNQLYDLHGKFMERGSIDKSGLKTFLELGKIYEEAGGDDVYHDKLKPEVMSLSIKEQD